MNALEGVKILDFSTLLPGPYASTLLADLGAEVLKISMRGREDLVLDYPPFLEGTDVSVDQAWLGRNKKTMFLNLKKPEAVKIVRRLVKEYDIILEQNRPGTMARFLLDYESLKTENPGLIYCSLTGYGQTGPLRDRAGHDVNYLALSGNMAAAGRRETGPVLTNMQVADVAAGAMNAAVGILAALRFRDLTGKGQYVDVSMLDGMLPFATMSGAACLAGAGEPEREKERLNGGSLYDFYETADGRYLSVGALEPKFWANFCRAIGAEDLIPGGVEPEDLPTVKARIRRIIKGKTLAKWQEIFADADACTEPVLSLSEALSSEQTKARGMVTKVPLPAEAFFPRPDGTGRQQAADLRQNETEPRHRVPETVSQIACPIRFSETPAQYRHAGYPLGWHTEEVLRSLGYSEEEIKRLSEDGVT